MSEPASPATGLPFIDLIWSLTLVCPWDCGMCSVDAVHVRRRANKIELRSHGLSQTESIDPSNRDLSIYEHAAMLRQSQGLELTKAGKLRVLANLEGFNPKIDFSGGDPLVLQENVDVMEIASAKYGKHNVTLTATGAGLLSWHVPEIAPLVGELNFTYDSAGRGLVGFRPGHYARNNLEKAAQFAEAGVAVRAECPLTTGNCTAEVVESIYRSLHDAGIQTLLLMRLFGSGRGASVSGQTPSRQEYTDAIAHFQRLEERLGRPRIRLQCALRYLARRDLRVNPCDLVRESFGLLTDGTLLASPWAVDAHGAPLGPEWVLGNLAENKLSDLLRSEKVLKYRQRLDENFGHCKVFAYAHSTRPSTADRLFDRADPLYTDPMYEK
jgi:MoaA/NifB/PqqE/SkfB family radical SAM enzyme